MNPQRRHWEFPVVCDADGVPSCGVQDTPSPRRAHGTLVPRARLTLRHVRSVEAESLKQKSPSGEQRKPSCPATDDVTLSGSECGRVTGCNHNAPSLE